MLFVFFHAMPTLLTTETLPVLATLVRGSVLVGVPELLCCGSSLAGRSPPQLETYTFSPTTTGMYGATPTDTRAFTSPSSRLTSCSSLPRDEQTQSSFWP